jgi:hypothetical protein
MSLKKYKLRDPSVRQMREAFINLFDTKQARDIVREYVESLPQEEFLEFLNDWVHATREIKLRESGELGIWEKIH